MKKFFLSLSIILIIPLFLGCGSKKPAGFPKVVPCKVVLTDDGEPISQASISLVPEDESLSQSISIVAITDEKGVADFRTIQSTYYGNGAPLGEYRVLVYKSVDIEHTLSDVEIGNLPPDEFTAYMDDRQRIINSLPLTIPRELNQKNLTPITWAVSKKNDTLNIDIAEYKY